MLRMTISKIRKVCMMAFIPRVLRRGDMRHVVGKFEKLSHSRQKRTHETTNLGCEGESEQEKCQKLIDLAFAPNLPFTETIFTELDSNTKGATHVVFSRAPPSDDNHCVICKRIIEEIFGDTSKVDKTNKERIDSVEKTQVETLKATTAKVHEEKLVQKIEVINETPLVEAHKPNIEGFNVVPKVLGNKGKETQSLRQKVPQFNFCTGKNIKNSDNTAKTGFPNLDDLASRCLDSSSTHIDERLLKEMEQLGVPPTSGRHGKKRFDENVFNQPEIMKKPRRPVEKTDLDLMTIHNKNIARLKDGLPPPFELTVGKSIQNIVKVNPLTSTRASKKFDEQEYVPIPEIEKPLGKAVTANIHTKKGISGKQLLGHTTNSTGEDAMKLKNISCTAAKANPKPDSKNKINVVEHISVIIEESGLKNEAAFIPEIAEGNKTNEKILENLLQTRTEHLLLNKTISKNFVRDNSGIDLTDTIKDNILLESNFKKNADQLDDIHDKFSKPERVTPAHILYNTYVLSEEAPSLPQSKDSRLQYIDSSQFVNKETAQVKTDASVKEGSKTKPTDAAPIIKIEQHVKGTSEFAESKKLDDIYSTLIKPERVIPNHILHDTNMLPGEAVSVPQPNVVIREYIELEPIGSGETPPMATSKSIQAPLTDNPKKEVHSEMKSIKDVTIAVKTHISKKEDIKFTNIEPVIVAETGRLQIKNPHLSSESNVNTSAAIKDQFTKSILAPENIVKPLLDKGTFVDVAKDPFERQVPAVESLKSNNQEAIPLSELLKKVRERNRMEYCRDVELKMHCAPQVDPVVGECGKKPPICPPTPVCPPAKTKCPPPTPICPPPKKTSCPPPKSPCPKPCKPKCPPPCNPDPCGPKSRCPPKPANPCDKSKCNYAPVSIREILALLVYYGSQFHIPHKSVLPLMICTLNMKKYELQNERLQNPVLLTPVQGKAKIEQHMMKTNDNVEYARTYDPWSPIPSWTVPDKQLKSKLVCPKEGCKDAPPRLNPPCSDINPCVNLPKPNTLAKRSFSVLDYVLMAFTKTCY
ncbi:hypothetical protein evm_012890 [Chilo suppressalis]|nr:hypothetical protein evm_012890 [Chilo suppressalis]